MNTKAVLFIQSNPLESHRPAEGIRIALGLTACNHSVDIILVNHASRLLSERIENLVNGERTQQYLAELKERVSAFFIDKETIEETCHISLEYKTILLSRNEIAQKISAAACFIQF